MFPFAMAARSCRVTITDMEGVAHTVEVTASSLYEAVALGLTAIRGNKDSDFTYRPDENLRIGGADLQF